MPLCVRIRCWGPRTTCPYLHLLWVRAAWCVMPYHSLVARLIQARASCRDGLIVWQDLDGVMSRHNGSARRVRCHKPDCQLSASCHSSLPDALNDTLCPSTGESCRWSYFLMLEVFITEISVYTQIQYTHIWCASTRGRCQNRVVVAR